MSSEMVTFNIDSMCSFGSIKNSKPYYSQYTAITREIFFRDTGHTCEYNIFTSPYHLNAA